MIPLRHVPLVISLVALVFAGLTSAGRCAEQTPAPKAAPAAAERQQSAEEVLRLAVAQYRSGEAGGLGHLELIHVWSMRILKAELDALGEAGTHGGPAADAAWQKHIDRLAYLEKLATERTNAGKASPAESTAATFYRLDAQHVLQQQRRLAEQFGGKGGGTSESAAGAPGVAQTVPQPTPQTAPKPATPPTRPGRLVLRVEKDGQITSDGKPLPRNELTTLLQRRTPVPVTSVEIRAGSATPYAYVLELTHLCKRFGIRECSFVAEP
jgi:biopolymer transport protein ExbD